MGDARHQSKPPDSRYPVTIHLSYGQAQAVHKILSAIANDPDWADLVGAETIDLAEDAHDAILYAAATWQTQRDAETEILDLSHRLQPWRPDTLTRRFIANPPHGLPFCRTCADWHDDTEAHSSTGPL